MRFLPFRRRAPSVGDTVKSGTGKEKRDPNRPLTWEDNWEKGEYPFVQLDSHRASCAICLLDFQEPRRVGVGAQESDATNAPAQTQTPVEMAENQSTGEPVAQQEDTANVTGQMALLGDDLSLRLQDAGQGAQPLRLLKCGHVFHVSTIVSCGRSGDDDLELSYRKRAWTHGCSMYQVAVRYVSDLFASSQTRRAWSRRRVQRAGGGSEEVGGEDPRDRVLTGLGWRSCVLYFLDSNHRLSALQNVQYSMGKYEIAIPPTCSHITSNGLLNYRCQLQVMGQGATFQGRRCASILSGGATVIYPFQESDCAQHGLCLGDFKMQL